ncbi:uncharacterized protein EV154DRAFT_484670 [Mucor mucedo]|uniref:uncharacterized protein n=1 Tax=Mucor mucedo TaxID=29922 RepID=UPI002220F14C|nr:uncharacterized protein EV154DRAFT_484670 [Mucor mucedo]KAI7887849.1 hypothetical protein EV154DRAFT_484670 [Mucor mucedo]
MWIISLSVMTISYRSIMYFLTTESVALGGTHNSQSEESHDCRELLDDHYALRSGTQTAPHVIDTSSEDKSSTKSSKGRKSLASARPQESANEEAMNSEEERSLIISFSLRGMLPTNDDIQKFIFWIRTKKIPPADCPALLSEKDSLKRFAGRLVQMRRRANKNKCSDSKFPTKQALLGICAANNYKCCITGSEIQFHNPKSAIIPFWALSIDHRKPLDSVKKDPNAWGIQNLQPMSRVMNTIKSNLTDEE